MLLLDTGAPTSFGKGLEGVPGVPEDPPEAMLEALTIDWLVDHVHHPFDGLVGAEVLRERTLVIDPSERTVELTTEIIDRDAGVPVRDLLNVPIFDGAVAGSPAGVIFDTGAPLGFVPAELVAVMTRAPDLSRGVVAVDVGAFHLGKSRSVVHHATR